MTDPLELTAIAQDIVGVVGRPLEFTVRLTGATLTEPVITLFNEVGDTVYTGVVPACAMAGADLNVAFTPAQTTTVGALNPGRDIALSYEIAAKVNGSTYAYGIIARKLTFLKMGSATPSTTTVMPLTVNVGAILLVGTIGLGPSAQTAATVSVADVGGHYTGSDVEAVLAELSSPTFVAVGVGTAPTALAPLNVRTIYVDTSIVNPLSIGNKNIKSLVNVGTASSVAATGSVLGFDASVVVANTSQAGAEHCPMFAVLRYDQGTGFAGSGTPGRGWLTDWTVHGAIETQQQVCNGMNLVMRNYYNGQPSNSPMGAAWLVTGPTVGGAVDATHQAATTYPVGVGLGIIGLSTGSARGFDVGIQIGGTGSGWEVASSRLGTGIDIRDHDTRGIYIHTANLATAHAIDIDTDAGNVVIGGTQVLDGTNYTEPKVAIARSNTVFGLGAGQGNAHHLFAFSISNQGADLGASIGLGGRVDNTPVYRAFGYIAGRKLNGNVGDSSGYLQFATHKNGVGMREWLRIDADGLFTLSDAANIVLNATTGTKLATATTQKLGFWNATPAVQRSGWGTPSGTLTRTTFVSDSVTLPALAAAVAALITDLKTIGIVGA